MTIVIGKHRITLPTLKHDVLPEVKERVVNNIRKANSKEYQMDIARHGLIEHVLTDILNDPYWMQIAIEAAQHRAESRE